uniref:Putative secreted protein n=1 Tax=Ixodes ricinus TaxID=34613 RepID=A0A6B0TRX0_IXORI
MRRYRRHLAPFYAIFVCTATTSECSSSSSQSLPTTPMCSSEIVTGTMGTNLLPHSSTTYPFVVSALERAK